MNYKVLWIDDLYKIQEDFIGFAEQYGIDIFPFESHEEGIEELRNNLNKYHAVILDAKVKLKRDDTTTDLRGLQASRDYLIKLNKSTYMPFFILTGQPDYATSEMFEQSYGKFYTKGSDNEKLLNDIKVKVDNKEEYIIQKEFEDVFKVCTDEYIGKNNYSSLLNLLSFLKSSKTFNDEKFNTIRKLFESVLWGCHKYGLIPEECVNRNEINLTWSLLFLQGKEVRTEHTTISGPKVMPDIISNFAFTIKDITSIGSHYANSFNISDEDRKNNKAKIAELQVYISNPYLVKSLIYQMLDVLLWFKAYVDKNPNIDVNKIQWDNSAYPNFEEKRTWIKGTITKISYNGWGNFQPYEGGDIIGVPPDYVSNHSLYENQQIEIITKPSPDGRKTFIKEIRIQ